TDVNDYLREIAGAEFSAKDFRTWAGTVLAAVVLRAFEQFETKAQAKKNLVQAIERVASRLGNTPAVCRKCYIHPIVMESYLAGQTVEQITAKADDALNGGLPQLNDEERAVLSFLKLRLAQNAKAQKARGGLMEQLTASVGKKTKKRG
ncbi:MAG: DNA topoisomerase IB, partial [Opitutus sp.]